MNTRGPELPPPPPKRTREALATMRFLNFVEAHMGLIVAGLVAAATLYILLGVVR